MNDGSHFRLPIRRAGIDPVQVGCSAEPGHLMSHVPVRVVLDLSNGVV